MSETLHSILDTHPDIICRFDTDLTLTYVNTAAASYFGREKPDIIGRNLLAISAEESRDAISKNVSGVSESTPTITGIQHFEEKTDFEYIHWTTSGLFDEGKLIGYQSTGRDISVRQRLTAQLEEKTRSLESAEAELRTVLNAVPALIWYKDDQNKILHLNKAAADSMNMTVEDVQGQNTYDLFGEAAKSYHEDDLRVIRSGEALRGHVEPYTPDDGQQGWVQTDKIPLMDGPDGPRILVVSTDISKLKDQEAILKSVNKNLDDFASMVSHDLQAPLRKIGITQELMELELGDDYPEMLRPYMDDIANGVTGMRDLIRSFLNFMKSSPRGIALSTINIVDVLKNTLEELKDDIALAGATITIPDTATYVRGEANLLEQVFKNLLSNAIKYRSPNTAPKVDIIVKGRKQYWSILVRDNGIGIDPSFSDQIFDVFGRAKPESRIEGSGIGLALCRRIVTLHGGTIDLIKHSGDGSLFQIDLYRARKPSGG